VPHASEIAGPSGKSIALDSEGAMIAIVGHSIGT
jgi:hypothetical protein